VLLAAPALAGWIAVDTFESYTITGDSNLDAIAGKGYWVVGGNTTDSNVFYVALDPAGGTNQVLRGTNFTGQLATARNSDPLLSVAESNTTPYTIYFEVRVATDGNFDVAWGFNATGSYAHGGQKGFSQFINRGTGLVDPNLDIKVRVGLPTGGAGGNADVGDANNDTWYSLWYVIHNRENPDANTEPRDSYDVYIKGGAFTSQTLLMQEANFRSGSFQGFLPYFTNLISGTTGTSYLDNLYIDTTAQNLDPIPEPATLALLAAGGAALAIRRRRRSRS
jgi:hypothetical protein